MLRAEQLVHQRLVHSDPLVLGATPLKTPAPAVDRDQPVSRILIFNYLKYGLYHLPKFNSGDRRITKGFNFRLSLSSEKSLRGQ